MKRRWKKSIIWVSVSLASIILAAGIYFFYVYSQIKNTVQDIYEPTTRPVYISRDPEIIQTPSPLNPTEKIAEDHTKPFTVLVLGVDQRKNDPGRSDTMIVLSVSPQHHSILMFNIPRDTRTEIIGHGTIDKINHAYAFGGVDMSIQSVEHFLDYPIDYYVKVNMETFQRIVDKIGGVQVNNPFAFDYQGASFPKGELHLNGADALLYSRMRYDDPRGDFGRNTRQRDIIRSLLNELLQIKTTVRLQSLLNEVGTGVKTNITFEDMKTFMMKYRSVIEQIETVEIAGKGSTINGIWYYLVGDTERTRIHTLLKNHQLE